MKSNKVIHHPSNNADNFSDVGAEIEALRTAGAYNAVSTSAAFSNDNRLLRSDGTAKGAQASAVTCDDSGNISGIGTLATTGNITQNSVQVATVNTNSFAQQQGFGTATLTDAASISWNLQTQQVAKVTLGGSRTLAAPSNMVDGYTYILRVIQDGTGSRTLSYNSVFKWPNGTAPVLSTAASSIDILTFVSDGTNMYGAIQKGFA